MKDGDVEVAELSLGPSLPALRIGGGAKTLVYLAGLSLHPGNPTGAERQRALSGWEALLPDYTIYRIARRVRPLGTTFAEMADDTIEAIEGLPSPVDLIGASTGGIVAMHVAAARPDLVRRLVLVITATRASEFGIRMGDQASEAARAGRWRRAFATVLPIGAASRPGQAALAALGWLLGPRLIGVPSDPTLMLAELAAWRSVDAAPLLPRIAAPTLVLGGGSDRVFPPDLVRALADGLPDATAVISPKVAHDWPARYTVEHIAPFLARA